MKGVVVAGTASSVGKTVTTLAIIAGLRAEGVDVQPAKAGPDFIDPGHHASVAGKPSRTLDRWLQGSEGLIRNYARGSGDICIVEGVMGLYDGDRSSTAQVAEALDLPVILVVDGSGGMESVAATALGFREYARSTGRSVEVVGVIAQRTHAGRHAEGIRDALPDELPLLGFLPPTESLEIPDRHLGLYMGAEAALDTESLVAIADHLDLPAIQAAAATPPAPQPKAPPTREACQIAIARDAAFCFTYPGVIERLEERASVRYFSPVAGDECPACDGIYLPGGYPELHAEALSKSPTLPTIAARASEGLPILGECGGLMVLAESLELVSGDAYPMAGVLPAQIQMHERFQALDHIEYEATETSHTAPKGASRRGHEFHYSRASVDTDAQFAFRMNRGQGIDGEHDGLTEYNTLGTYSHLHAESGAFDTFIDIITT